MGLSQLHVLGRNQRFYAARETTFGTFVPPAGNNALKVLKSTMTKEVERRNRMDARQTASLQERITGMIKCEWSLDCYALPSGTAGTPPNVHPLLFALMGGYTNVPSTSDTYTLSDLQTFDSTHGNGTCSLVREFNGVAMQQAISAWVESCKIEIKGGDEPKLSFAGGCQDIQLTGYSTLQSGAIDTATVAQVQTSDAYAFVAGYSRVTVGTSNGGGTGHLVTAVDTATGNLTVSPAISGAQSTGAVVAPWVPTETTAGSPISYTLGSLSLDTVTDATIVSAEVTIANKWKPFTDQAFTSVVPDLIRGYREVTGTLTVKARADQIINLARAEVIPQTQRAVVLTCGSGAGHRMVINLPHLEFEKPVLDVPEAEEGLVKLPFVAMATSAGADEISIAWT